MDQFHPYDKMPEGLSKLGLDVLATKALDKVDWVVTEKIHGANFSFVHDAEGLGYAKRKERLTWASDFFAFQTVAERLDEPVMRVVESVRRLQACDTVLLHGELYGGGYPHADVPSVPGLQPIQTGVWYAPRIEFSLFDVAIVNAAGDRKFLDYARVVDMCESAGLPYSRPLLRGRLHHTMAFDTRFNSRVPATLGLPPLLPNLVEGVVIKPWTEIEIQGAKGPVRPIFKVKNVEFAEEQFHEAQAWHYQHEGASATERLQFLVPELAHYLNENRYNSARSKLGGNAHAEVIVLTVDDALESFAEANGDLLDQLSQDDRTWLRSRLLALAMQYFPA